MVIYWERLSLRRTIGCLEAELLEQPATSSTLLVLGLEHFTSRLKELLLGLRIGEGISSEVALQGLDHGVLDSIAGRHDVRVVHNLDESLYARATLDKLLHLLGRLAHGLGNSQRGLGHTGNNAVPVWALLVALIIGFKDDGLLAGVSALKADHDLAVLKKFNRLHHLCVS